MKLTEEDKDKIVKRFKKICIDNLTSEEYNTPADSKDIAELTALEMCLFLREALDNKR